MRSLASFGMALGLVLAIAPIASAHHLNTATASTTCGGYCLTLGADSLTPGDNDKITYTFTLTPTGGRNQITVSGEVDFIADSTGTYSNTVCGNWLNSGMLTNNYTVTGTATLITPSDSSSLSITFQGGSTSGTLACGTTGTPQLTVSKTADSGTVTAGGTVGFTVTISNPGTAAVTGLTLSDPLPAGAGGDINWTIDTGAACFVITGSVGSQSLALNPACSTLNAGASLSVHITSPTNAGDASGGGATGFDTTGTAAAGVISLGTANNYGVLGLKNTAINNSLVTIHGNEGVSQGGKLTNMAPSTITGNVYEFASGQYSGPGHLGGTVITNPALLTQNDSDALTAATTAAGLPATQTFGNISSNTTVTGNGALNVIDINGNINLNNASLTLTGTASDVFVVNVTGTLTCGGTGGLMLGGGVTANHVLYNLTHSGSTVTSHVGNVFFGTLLAPNMSFNLDGTFNGEIIGGGQSIALLSGAQVFNTGALNNTATVSATSVSSVSATAIITIN